MGQIDQLLRRIAGAPVRTVRRWRSRGISWKVITSNLLPVPSLSIKHHQLLPSRAGNGQRICYQCDSCFNPVSEAKVRSKSSAWTICCCLRGAKRVAEGFSLHVLEPGEKFIKHRVHLMVSLNNQFVLSSFDLCGCIEGKRTSSKLSLPQKNKERREYTSPKYMKKSF